MYEYEYYAYSHAKNFQWTMPIDKKTHQVHV